MLRYNNALDPTLDRFAGPPYYFSDVNMQGFPLVADPVQLAYFVDSYLNIGPPEVARYEPACPFVFLLFISYGQQGQSPISGGMEFGFTSQTQISFAIPLARYHLDRQGQPVFRGWSCLMPFNFTDGWASVLVSRTVYGWNTSMGWLESGTAAELDPDLWQVDYSLKTPIIPDLWRGNPQIKRELLRVERAPACEPLRWPPSSDAASNPLYLLPRLMTEGLESAELLCSLLGWWWRIGVLRDIPDFLCNLLKSSAQRPVDQGRGSSVGSYAPALNFNLASLKQFRDAEYDNTACYQAILETGLALNGIQDFGLLGASHLLTGDLSGGYRIRLNLYDSLPILSLLGLKAAQFEDSPALIENTDSFVSAGVKGNTRLAPVVALENMASKNPARSSALLSPVLPFFASYNFTTSPSRVLCWRLRNTDWFIETNSGQRRTTSEVGVEKPTLKRGNPYNSALGAAGLDFAGPFEYSEMTLRVLPLRLNKNSSQKESTCQRFCDRYLNKEAKSAGYYFEVLGDFVFILINSYERMVSASENVGNWAERSVEIAIPVKLTRKDQDTHKFDKFVTYGLITPYNYNNSLIASLTSYETIGVNVSIADIESPPSVWDTTHGPRQDQPVLRLWTSLYPAVSLDAYPLPTVLIEVLETNDKNENPFQNKKSKAKKDSGYLHKKSTIEFFNFKQFRGADLQNTACYQAIVASSQEVIKCSDAYRFKQPLRVRIHHNAELPLVRLLGLRPGRSTLSKPSSPHRIWRGDQVNELNVEKPFWFTLKARSTKSRNIIHRGSGQDQWQVDDHYAPLSLQDHDCVKPDHESVKENPDQLFKCLFLGKSQHDQKNTSSEAQGEKPEKEREPSPGHGTNGTG